MSQGSYRNRMRRMNWLGFGVALVAGIAVDRIAQFSTGPGENFWIVLPLLLLVGALALASAIPWWKRVDDMQKQGHLLSWYWGGLAGGLFMLFWIIAGAGHQSDAVKGATAMALGQSAGFFIAWIIWWWRGRGAAE